MLGVEPGTSNIEHRTSNAAQPEPEEPTPNPSQPPSRRSGAMARREGGEGNWHDADECLLASWEGAGVGRFMESPDGFLTAHWENEPRQQVGRGVFTAPYPLARYILPMRGQKTV